MTIYETELGAVRPFIILSGQRSGSTFVRIWLNQHSKIHCYGEVFLSHYKSMDGFRAYCERSFLSEWLFAAGHARLVKSMGLRLIPNYLIVEYLDALFCSTSHPAPWTDITNRVNTAAPRTYRPVIGFKLMYNTLTQYPPLQKWIESHCPHIIHLTRHNLLRKYVSLVRMHVTKVAHSKDPLLPKNKVVINVDEFIKFAERQVVVTKAHKDRLSARMPYLELSYENYFSDPGSSKEAILNFLGLDIEDMPFHQMKKIGSTLLSEDIKNWEEVSSRLRGTAYAAYLEVPEHIGVTDND